MLELTVVMPVYNEEAVIQEVISSWIRTLDALGVKYIVAAYNDGSRDSSLLYLRQLENVYPNVLRVIDKPNTGHGPTILEGYREAESEWIFQVDSDNEMESIHFNKIWNLRQDFDLIVGARYQRKSPLARRLITAVSRLAVRSLYGSGIVDVNSPFRLYRVSAFKDIFHRMSPFTFAPNIILTGYAVKRGLRTAEVQIPIKGRLTGSVSIRRFRLFKAAAKALIQTLWFRFSHL